MSLESIYARVPKVACRGKCAQSCGPIDITRKEHLAICKIREITKPTNLDCPLLESGRCTVYDVRPLICRLWGVAEGMLCPYGCEVERVLSKVEAYALLAEAVSLSHGDVRRTHCAAQIARLLP